MKENPMLGYGLVGTLVLILDIIALVDLLGRRTTLAHKLLWILLILALPFIGMVLYFLVGQNSNTTAVI